MLISCPKCHSVYDISTKRISDKGKKFKCAECGEIWTVYPEVLKVKKSDNIVAPAKTKKAISAKSLIDTSNNNQNTSNDLDVMFQRLSQNTQNLFQNTDSEDSLNWWQRIKYRIIDMFTPYTIIAFLLPISIIFAAVLLYCYRYDIAAKIPGMDDVYAKMNYDSLYKGKDLVFKEVNILNIREKGHLMLEISGRLQNVGSNIVTLLPVQAQIINQQNKVVEEKVHIIQERQLEPDFSALFRIVMPYPDEPNTKLRLTLKNDTVNN